MKTAVSYRKDNAVRICIISLFFFSTSMLSNSGYAQTACSISNAFVDTRCVAPDANVFMGVITDSGATYTWFKDGERKAGPLPGDGGSTSFAFALNTASTSGHYYIEKTIGGVTTCINNTQIVFVPLPAAQTLTGGGILCNGQRVLSISNSEPNVSYELMFEDNPTGEIINSTGTGAKSFSPVNYPGRYSVRARNNACFEEVYRNFGNVFVDEFLVSPILNSTTTNTASISWLGSGSFIAEYGPSGFTPGTGATAGPGGTVISSPPSNFTITGLAVNGTYDVYVRQLCSPGVYASSGAITFKTNCNAISSFPHTQGFEAVSAPALPNCWRILDRNADYSSFETITILPRTGTRCLYLPSSFSSPAHDDYVFIQPLILNGNQRLRFWVRAYFTTSPQQFQVKISTTNNGIGSFSTIFSETITSEAYEEKVINLNAYTGTVYIALHAPSSAATTNSLLFDDFVVENIPSCPGPSLVKVNGVTNNSANISWNGSGNFIVEYGPPGFAPGTNAAAGGSGTIITPAISPLNIPGLASGVSYDVYVRQNCGAGSFSANSAKKSFTAFLGCTGTTLTTCNPVMVSIPAGTGVYDFQGVYPYNSTGNTVPGREMIYSFTPTATGVYYLDVTFVPDGLTYLYKPASLGCSNKDWIGIANVYSTGKYPIGMLQQGLTYYILVDNPDISARSQTFRVCRATVAAPAGGGCIASNFTSIVPANSTKIEYLIDNAGNLIAALDFSAVTSTVGFPYLFYSAGSGPLRRDNANKEYLDRHYTIATSNVIPHEPIGVTLYFRDAELQRLINEPNDSIGDVNSPADIRISRMVTACDEPIDQNTSAQLLNQSGNGVYDLNSKYVTFTTNSLASFYLHGGNTALFSDKNICPGYVTNFTMMYPGDGFYYQWQVDTGSGFVNIVDGVLYSGTTTPGLDVHYPPTSFYGYKYRCVATKGATTIISDPKIMKFAMTWIGGNSSAWENPYNWGCSEPGKVYWPDANTDVIIPQINTSINFNPSLNSNFSCRSIWALPGASLSLSPNVNLLITGK